MADYLPDELNAAQDDLDNAEVMKEIVERCKASLRYRAEQLNKNADLIDEMCQHIDEAVQDTIVTIIALAKAAGAEESQPRFVAAAAAE